MVRVVGGFAGAEKRSFPSQASVFSEKRDRRFSTRREGEEGWGGLGERRRRKWAS